MKGKAGSRLKKWQQLKDFRVTYVAAVRNFFTFAAGRQAICKHWI
jgi:hypothetical protein